MVDGNPFYVQPGGDITAGLQGLNVSLQQFGLAQERKREAERIEQIEQQAMDIYQTGDMDAMHQFAIQNPEVGQRLAATMNFKNQATKDNYTDSIVRGLANPKLIPKLLRSRQAFLKTQGAEDTEITDTALEQYEANPEQFMIDMEADLILLDPKKYDLWKKITETPEKDLTTDVKNFEYYAKLYKSNPEMADKFAVQVGITPAGSYEELMAELQMIKLRQEISAEDVKATEKIEAKAKAKEIALEKAQKAETSLGRTINQIDDIMAAVEDTPGTTGLIGSILGKIAGTEAYGIRENIETVKAKLAIDMITEMKSQSSTGATGFGALSENELRVIQSTVDRLEPNMDKKRFLQAMREVKAHYELWKEYNDKALAEEARLGITGAQASDKPATQMTDEEISRQLINLEM